MAERTEKQILDQIVYATNCAILHYGPGLSEEGLLHLRKLLKELGPFWTDASFRVDMIEGDQFVDFHERIIWPEGWDKLNFEEIL